MAKGIKTGGRLPGTPNKRTQEVEARLAEMGVDPIEGMARIAADEAAPIELRARMYAELAPYVHAKRKALEQAEEQPVRININLRHSNEVKDVDGGTNALPNTARSHP